MYKTNFVVKYHDIENELILNLHRKMMKQHELEDIAEKEAAAAKLAAAILEKENQIKALELLAQEQETFLNMGMRFITTHGVEMLRPLERIGEVDEEDCDSCTI